MHRSGTSCLAGSLERCGLYLGPVTRSSRANPRGNHEPKWITRIHARILRESGGDWRTPPSTLRLSSWRRWTLRRKALQLARHAPCGLKDPRLLLMLEVWEELVPGACLVGTFRHPAAVARSLAARNDMEPEEGHRLWLRYNEALVRRHRMAPFPIVEFDLADLEGYLSAVLAIARGLGLEADPNADAVRAFAQAAFSHHAADGPVPPACRAVFDYLRANRLRPGEPTLWASPPGPAPLVGIGSREPGSARRPPNSA